MARPRTGQTPVRHVRVPDHIWHAAQERAKAENVTVTDVIVRALYRYAVNLPRGVRDSSGNQSDTPTPAAP